MDNFHFWKRPLVLPDVDPAETNVYDMRLTAHQDGWIYGIFCSERHDDKHRRRSVGGGGKGGNRTHAQSGGLGTVARLESGEPTAQCGVASRICEWEICLYTRPQDDFINAGNGGGIGWALIDDITRAEVKDEMIINHRYYHTIKEVKNGEGPHPIRTSQGWLHLAHGVRGCAAGLRYVLYLYMTAADEPWRVIAEPAGYLLAPLAGERVGDVSNVLFSNGWIADDDGTVYIYYASSDTRMHVAVSTVDRLVDYCLHTPADGLRSAASVAAVNALIDRNEAFLNG